MAGVEASKPFDLSKGPLLRAKLLRLSPGEHILVLVIHHIIVDGWSMNLLFHEKLGQTLLMIAIGMQVIGFFWIRKVIRIEV